MALLLAGLLLVLAPGTEAAVKSYQTMNVQGDGTTQDTVCDTTTQFTSAQTVEMLEEPVTCTGTKEDKIKWTFGATEGTNETEMQVAYFDNGGYLVDTLVTGQATGNEIGFKAKNSDGTFRIKLVEVNPSTGAVISVLDTHTESTTDNVFISVTDLSDLTGTVGTGNTFGFQMTFQADTANVAQPELKFGSYATADKREIWNVDETAAPSAALTGTLANDAWENEIVAGGETLVITLTADTWDATVGADNAVTDALIAGIDSDGGEATGWDAVVKAGLDFNDVTRTSDTVVTLVSLTDSDLKHVGEAIPGKVEHASGFDIVFTDTVTPRTKLDHEIESYTASTGEIVMWVRLPTLRHDVDTDIYIYYGNSTISSSQEAVDGTWESNFKGVWHLDEATSATNVDSSGGNANNGTPSGGPTQQDPGKISKGQDYTGSDEQSTISNHADLDMDTHANFTISAWVYPTSHPTAEWPIVYGYADFETSLGLSGAEAGSDGRIEVWYNDSDVVHGDTVVPLNQWSHIAVVRTASNTTVYLNGAQDGTPGSAPAINNSANDSSIGSDVGGADFIGDLDEVRVVATNRSGDWLKTEHDNQNNQGTGAGKFIKTLGSEEAATSAATWDATIGANNSKTTDLINGIDSDGVEGTGWDAVVKAGLDFNDVTRTSDTVVTITLGAEATLQHHRPRDGHGDGARLGAGGVQHTGGGHPDLPDHAIRRHRDPDRHAQ